MENFVYQNATKVVFGKGAENNVGQETAAHSKKVLLHYGGGSIKKTGLYDRITASLTEAGVSFVELGGVQPNPRVSLVREGIQLCRDENIDFILAVGGGSVIDSAKAIGTGFHYDGDVWDFYTGKAEVTSCLPLGVVLTIPAAGSETSGSSVISEEDNLFKRSIGHNVLRPKFALLNPEISFTLPPYQIAAGVTDMMSHVIERYFTTQKNVELTDRLCEATLRTVIHNGPKALQNPSDYDAQAEVMWAGTIAHNDWLSTGRIGDWATHGIEHEISAIYDLTHGAGLAIVFPAWMTYVYKTDVNRFAQFANRVWDVEINVNDLEETALTGIQKTKEFFRSIGMPTSLQDANIDGSRIDEMAKKATDRGPLGNFVKLHEQDVKAILELAQ